MERNLQMSQTIDFSMGVEPSLHQTGFGPCPQTRFVCTANGWLQFTELSETQRQSKLESGNRAVWKGDHSLKSVVVQGSTKCFLQSPGCQLKNDGRNGD